MLAKKLSILFVTPNLSLWLVSSAHLYQVFCYRKSCCWSAREVGVNCNFLKFNAHSPQAVAWCTETGETFYEWGEVLYNLYTFILARSFLFNLHSATTSEWGLCSGYLCPCTASIVEH